MELKSSGMTLTMIGIILMSITLSSCMHLGGSLMHGGMGHESEDEYLLKKEVISGNIRAVATFPPVKAGKHVVITLTLTDLNTGKPISGAQVWFHDEYLHKDRPNMTHDESDSGHGYQSHDVNFQSIVKESSTEGEYSYSYTTLQSGLHRLVFHVAPNSGSEPGQEVNIETEIMIHPDEGSHGGISGWMDSGLTYAIIGSAIMGAMMIVALLGGIHI